MRISFVNFTKTTVAINTKLTSKSFTHHIITFELSCRDGIPFSLCLTAVLVNQTNFGVVKQQHVMKYCQSGAITPPRRRNSCLVTLVPVHGQFCGKKIFAPKTGGTPLLNIKKTSFCPKSQIFCIGAGGGGRVLVWLLVILSLSLYSGDISEVWNTNKLLSTLLLISTCVVTVYKAKVHFESGSHLQTMLNFDQCFIFWPIL